MAAVLSPLIAILSVARYNCVLSNTLLLLYLYKWTKLDAQKWVRNEYIFAVEITRTGNFDEMNMKVFQRDMYLLNDSSTKPSLIEAAKYSYKMHSNSGLSQFDYVVKWYFNRNMAESLNGK